MTFRDDKIINVFTSRKVKYFECDVIRALHTARQFPVDVYLSLQSLNIIHEVSPTTMCTFSSAYEQNFNVLLM